MDCAKVGQLIRRLRTEQGLTQKQLADRMNISDKAISKWERGLGCPDVSLLRELSGIFQVNIEQILSGNLDPNNADGGNVKKIKFFLCPTCGSVMTATGEVDLFCCGRKLSPLIPNPSDTEHFLTVESIENDYHITFPHEMTKKHYISFVAYVTYDRLLLVKLYPEQSGELRFPRLSGGKLYFCCNRHGFWFNA